MRIKRSLPERYFVSHGMQYRARIVQIMSNMCQLWNYDGQLYEYTTKWDTFFARRYTLKISFKQAILRHVKYMTRHGKPRIMPKLCQLCLYANISMKCDARGWFLLHWTRIGDSFLAHQIASTKSNTEILKVASLVILPNMAIPWDYASSSWSNSDYRWETPGYHLLHSYEWEKPLSHR